MSIPNYHVPQPQRVRSIRGSFAWIDHRLLRDGYLAILSPQEHGLYLFLALAADRNGVSFYRQEKIADQLGLDFGQFQIARDRLIDLDLLAFEPYALTSPNGFYQVLPIERPAPDMASRTLATLCKQALRQSRQPDDPAQRRSEPASMDRTLRSM